MKLAATRFRLLPLLAGVLLTASARPAARADIQAPPASEQSPTRKLGRGLGNIAFGASELPVTLGETNTYEGNSAAWSYGFVRGLGRGLARIGVGVWEVATWPFPLNKGKYTPTLRSEVPWIYSGYQEFPPELGFETRYRYTRETGSN